MSVKFNDDGSIETFNGDDFGLRIGRLPIGENIKIFWEVQNAKSEKIFEKQAESNGNDFVVLEVTKENTEACTVAEGKLKEVYYHAIKFCKDGKENTATIKGTEFGKRYKFIVYSKRAEREENE